MRAATSFDIRSTTKMGYFTALKSLDWDDWMSYATVKTVKVKDRRLGCLHYSFLLGIFLYIVAFTLLYEKKYLLTESPEVSFRVSLMQPSVPTPANQLPYCQNDTNLIYNGFPTYPCRYYKEQVVVFPITEQSAMLASSRITVTNCTSDCDFTTPCEYTVSPEEIYFVADIERFTLMIDHAIYATNLNIQRNAKAMDGKLLDLNGNEMTLTSPNRVGQGNNDILELSQLLKAAGVNSLDIVLDPESDEPESLRYAGTILLVVLTYSNQISFNTGYIAYTISVRQVADTEFKSEEAVFSNIPNSYQNWNRHGIRLLFISKGTVGAFDFQTLLINLIAGAALVSLATIAVDLIALYILPQKETYRQYMLESTPEFSEFRSSQSLNTETKIGITETEPLISKSSISIAPLSES